MKMKEKRSKGPQIWRLRQPQLFHTDVKKLPPMADTLSFNWKRNVRMSVWVSLFLSNRKLLFSQLCFPAQSANKESDFPHWPRAAPAELSGCLRPCGAHRGEGTPEVQFGIGVWAQAAETRNGTPSPEPAGTAPTRHVRTTYGMVSGSARLTFRPSLPSASLPGRDFLSIIDRRPAVELVGGSHRKVSLARQALCSLKGNQRGALSRPLVCFFLFSARLRFARTSWRFGTATTWSSSASSFLWLRPQRPVAMTTAPRDSLVWRLAGLLRESGEWTSGWAEAGREGQLPTF